MHLNDGQLRAKLDGELEGRAEAHLDTCSQCQARLTRLAMRMEHTHAALASVAPRSSEAAPSPGAAHSRLLDYLTKKEKDTMLNKLFSRPYRPMWVGLALAAILAIALVFPPVRAIANSFLGLFRVQELAVVSVDPSVLADQLGSSTQLQNMFSQDIQIEGTGEPITVTSAAEASQLAGISVRLPAGLEGGLALQVSSPGKMTFNVNLEHLQALLEEIDRTDIQLPPELDGSSVSVDLPSTVAAMFGNCSFDPDAARQAGYDPDDPNTVRLPRCTTLIQMASPTVTAPPGLDIVKIGEAYLQLLGMSPEEAARFSQQIDWTTTLVIPIPMNSAKYSEVTVDGVNGTLIEMAVSQPAQYMLMWVKDGVVYALTGAGNSRTALSIAGSLK